MDEKGLGRDSRFSRYFNCYMEEMILINSVRIYNAFQAHLWKQKNIKHNSFKISQSVNKRHNALWLESSSFDSEDGCGPLLPCVFSPSTINSETAITFWLPINYRFSGRRQEQYAVMVFTARMIALMLSALSSSLSCSRFFSSICSWVVLEIPTRTVGHRICGGQ